MWFRHRALRWLAVCLATASCSAPRPPTGAERDTLRVVDINVWSGLDYRGVVRMGTYETAEEREARYRALVTQLRALEPDVIGVHEANPVPDYVDRLAADLGYDAVRHMGLGGVRIGPVGLPWNLREGDAILARPDLGLRYEGRRRISGGLVGSFFSFHFADATQVLAASIGVNGRRVFLFATHWHAGNEKVDREWRSVEAERTLAFVDDVAIDGPAILMGDFNAEPAAPEVRRLLDAGFVDAHGAARGDSAGPTWNPGRNLNIQEHYAGADGGAERRPPATPDALRRIDLVLARPPLRVVDARVAVDRAVAGVHASDHFGVLADLAPDW